MELSTDQERLVRTGAMLCSTPDRPVTAEEFLSEAIGAAIDHMTHGWTRDNLWRSAIEHNGSEVTVATEVQRWENLKQEAALADSPTDHDAWITRPDAPVGVINKGTVTEESSLAQFAAALVDGLNGKRRQQKLLRMQVAGLIGYTTTSGRPQAIGRSLGSKLETLGVSEVKIDYRMGHQVGEMLDRARRYLARADEN